MSAEPKLKRETADSKVVEMRNDAGVPEAPARRRFSRRVLLMLGLPLAVIIIGGGVWLTGGRYASTDNAYLQLDRVTITAEVAGRIVETAVKENEAVHKGDLLFRIDPVPYENALHQAQAAVATARLQVEQLRAAYQLATAQVKTANDDLAYQQSSFQRQKDLLAKGVSSQAAFDEAQKNLHSAEQDAAIAAQRLDGARAALGGDPDIATEQHPAVMAAQALLDQAKLNLDNTTVRAPADGLVAQTDRLVVGQYVTNPAANPTALLALVKTDQVWVEANFKETDLNHMRPGQKATIRIDAYPGRKLTGTVASIGAGTGSEFSILPAQNATGNWVKVVQRVPVRLTIDQSIAGMPLRVGLSASVSIDTGYSRIPGMGTAQAAGQ